MAGPSRLAELEITEPIPDVRGWDLNKSLKPLLLELGATPPPIKSDAIKQLQELLPPWFEKEREKRAKEVAERLAERRRQEAEEKRLRAAARKKAEEDKAVREDPALRFWMALARSGRTPADVRLRLGSAVSVRAWAACLDGATSIASLDVSSHGLRDDAGVELAGALAGNASVLSLDLSGNLLGPATLAALARALERNSTLRSLCLDDNPLCAGDASGFEALASALGANSSLTSLSLFRTQPREAGGTALAAGVEASGSLLRLQLAPVDGVDVADAVAIRSALRRNQAALASRLAADKAARAADRRAAAEAEAARSEAARREREEAWVEEQRAARAAQFARLEREEVAEEERQRQERELAARPWLDQIRAAKAKEAAKSKKKAK